MRLAFIHGINNEDNTPETIEESWWNALVRGWQENGLPVKQKPRIEVGYYGKLLADAANGVGPDAVAQGDANASDSDLALEFLQAYQQDAGIDQDELNAALIAEGMEQEIVAQGLIRRRLLDVASVIERLLPRHGRHLARPFLRQATVYIENPGLARKIGIIVRKAILDDHNDPVLVVSHSLGTVVAYKILAESRQSTRDVPLFVTLGSPLGIGMMQKILPPRQTVPDPPIDAWLNGFRQDDVVTLGRPLKPHTLGLDGITNVSEGLIEEADKHSISAYLRSKPICERIHGMLP